MRKFDLAAAKAGAPVCTRSGKPARIVCWYMNGNPARWETASYIWQIIMETNTYHLVLAMEHSIVK